MRKTSSRVARGITEKKEKKKQQFFLNYGTRTLFSNVEKDMPIDVISCVLLDHCEVRPIRICLFRVISNEVYLLDKMSEAGGSVLLDALNNGFQFSMLPYFYI